MKYKNGTEKWSKNIACPGSPWGGPCGRHQAEDDEAGRGETRHPQLPDPSLP